MRLDKDNAGEYKDKRTWMEEKGTFKAGQTRISNTDTYIWGHF